MVTYETLMQLVVMAVGTLEAVELHIPRSELKWKVSHTIREIEKKLETREVPM